MSRIIKKFAGNGVLKKIIYVEENRPLIMDQTLGAIRKEIQDTVTPGQEYDLYEMLADANKLISLLANVVGNMYAVMPQAQKDAIPVEQKAQIDHAMSKMVAEVTWPDVQLAEEGNALTDRLIGRLGTIKGIVVKHKNK